MEILSQMISPVKAAAKATPPEAMAEVAVEAAKVEERVISLSNTARAWPQCLQ